MSLSRRTLVLLIAALRLDGDAFVLQTRVPLDDAPPCSRRARLAPIDSYPTERQPRAFGIDPLSRYLLSIDQLSNSMTSYSIDPASGRLTVLDRYLTGKNPNWVAFVVLS
jgi:hypothetical protein